MIINGEENITGLVLKISLIKKMICCYGSILMIMANWHYERGKKLKVNAPSCQTITLSEFTFIPRSGFIKFDQRRSS